MSKGTASMGKRKRKKIHKRCRRCGNRSFHIRKSQCASCGFGRSSKIKKYNWKNKTWQGTRTT